MLTLTPALSLRRRGSLMSRVDEKRGRGDSLSFLGRGPG
jgi:hypothetical protein